MTDANYYREFMRKPSIDRIDSNGDYTFDNCRFIEQGENTKRRLKPCL